MTESWPLELTARNKGSTLNIRFDNGQSFDLDAEYLRVESPSAEVKGHGPGQEQLVTGKRSVAISRLEPVGNYAVRIVFNDGHASGLYTWTYLSTLGRDHAVLWQSYLDRLKLAGATRG